MNVPFLSLFLTLRRYFHICSLFVPPEKNEETFVFMMFSGGIERGR